MTNPINYHTVQESDVIRYTQPNGNRLTVMVYRGTLSVMAATPDGRTVDIAVMPVSKSVINITSIEETS